VIEALGIALLHLFSLGNSNFWLMGFLWGFFDFNSQLVAGESQLMFL
jgi:hypothetical protein